MWNQVQESLVPAWLALVPMKCMEVAGGHGSLAVGHMCCWRTLGAGFLTTAAGQD